MSPLYTAILVASCVLYVVWASVLAGLVVLWLRFRAEQRRAVAFDKAWEQTARMLGALR